MTVPLPMIERRRIEATILKHVYETLKASHGIVAAQTAIAEAVRRASIEQGRELAAAAGGQTSLKTFADLQALWTSAGALEVTVQEQSDTVFAFDVTRCRYAELYREMGLGEIGHLLSWQRDGTFCEGYDPRMKLTRSQTIMQGASHCDFRYRLEEPGSDAPGLAQPDQAAVRPPTT
jgi:hypothetical protein